MTIAGRAVGGAPGPEGEGALRAAGERGAQSRHAPMTDWLRGGTARDGERTGYESRSASGREMLTGSALALTAEAKEGGLVSLWGRGALNRFDGREGDLSLDGEVTSVMLGADWTLDPGSTSGTGRGTGAGAGARTAGLLMAHSRGTGSYRGESEGKVSSTLTGIYPYGRYAVNDRVTVWGVAGYGAGELTLRPEDAATNPDRHGPRNGRARGARRGGCGAGRGRLRTRGHVGRHGGAHRLGEGGGAGGGDGRRDPYAARAEGAWRGLTLGEAGTMVPCMELGLRHDGGDAETGFGLDLGGGISWSDPKRGITVEVSGRGLLTHESRGFRDRGISGSFAWEPGQGSGRGPAVTLSQTAGSSATGGIDALLRRETLAGLAANDPGSGSGAGDLDNRRLELRFGYGFSAFGDRFTSTPELGLGLSNGQREYALGWRLNLAKGGPNAPELKLEATRREAANDNADPEHGVGLAVTARW